MKSSTGSQDSSSFISQPRPQVWRRLLLNIALRYGLPVALVFAAAVIIVRFGLGASGESGLSAVAPIAYNIAAICAIFLGIVRRKREANDQLIFKDGIKTGVSIALVYATGSCLFFVIVYLVSGPKLLMTEAGAANRPLWQTAALAYAGLFFGSLIFGLIYSTLISFFLAKRRSAK